MIVGHCVLLVCKRNETNGAFIVVRSDNAMNGVIALYDCAAIVRVEYIYNT